jgi:hypothetical protein
VGYRRREGPANNTIVSRLWMEERGADVSCDLQEANELDSVRSFEA